MNNINCESKKTCSGCGACTGICPVGAIEHTQNMWGFFEAHANEKCIECGKCRKICQKYQNIHGTRLLDAKMIPMQSGTYEHIMQCSSGGVAYEIGLYGIEHGYIVLGTIYNVSNNRAEMKLAYTREELDEFKGSKYVQSNSARAICQLVSIAKQDPSKKFMVFALPCQIFGIRKLLNESGIRNEVLLIELFCHGVPSYVIWDKFLDEQGFTDNTGVCFRDPRYPWHVCKMRLTNGTREKVLKQEEVPFYQMYFDNVALNDSCYECELRMSQSVADLRVGDCWGKRYSENHDGVSVCAIFSESAYELLDKLVRENRVVEFEEISPQEVMQSQSSFFYEKYDKKKWIDAVEKGIPLQKIVAEYRKQASYKKRIKWTLKKIMSMFPDKAIVWIKKWLVQ